jgi:AcrR family transcriptional regulator
LKSAGLALFAEEGYERTSINDIARRADFPVGTFYQHFRSKRQLLLVLMSDLLQKLSQLNLRPAGGTNLRESLRAMLSRTFSHDLHYLGVYRAWQEVALSDADLTRKQKAIHDWTTARVRWLFRALQQSPNARENVSIPGLARAMDHFFWGLLAQAIHLPKAELRQSIDAATHLIYHALFRDDG